MNIEFFWEEAIRNISIIKSKENVFVSFSEESIVDVYQSYISNISKENAELITKTVETIGGIDKSYYYSIKSKFDSKDLGSYSFLRFSFFILCAYEEAADGKYWPVFDSKLESLLIPPINYHKCVDILNQTIVNLKNVCQSDNKKFIDINFFGEKTTMINVGRIFSHSIFTSSSIDKVKKSLYELGFAYTIPVDLLTWDNCSEIIERLNMPRLTNLFNLSDSTKELIHECLKQWLINWEPTEEEELIVVTRQNFKIRGKLNISRIWIDEKKGDKKIKWEYGFLTKTQLGNEGRIYINQEKEIYIDLENSFNINDNLSLYIIVNYVNSVNDFLSIEELNLTFNPPKGYEGLKAFGLQLVSRQNYFANYFLQIDQDKIAFTNEPDVSKPVFLSSVVEIKDLHNSNNFKGIFETNNNQKYFFYRIRDSFSYERISFIKTNHEIDFIISGSTAGVSGKSIFTSSYPILLKYGSISTGYIEVLNSLGEILKSIDLNKQDPLADSLEFGLMEVGEYKIKVKNTSGEYEVLKNALDFKAFEIIENGLGDRRYGGLGVFKGSCSYDSVRSIANLNLINPNWIILFSNDNATGQIKTEALVHELFDFCFSKNDEIKWFIQPNKSLFFAALIYPSHSLKLEYIYPFYDAETYCYIDRDLNHYQFKAKAVNRGSVSIPMNSEFYISREFNGPIFINYYCFELVELDECLSNKNPKELIGKKVYILSNFKEPNYPEKLMNIVVQEFFPFKVSLNDKD